jgi:hypothetical protein
MQLAMIITVLVVVAFAIGFFWPRWSGRAQEKAKRKTARAAGTAEEVGGPVGDAAAGAIRKGGHIAQAAAHAGRDAHDEVTDSDEGHRQDRKLDRRHGKGASHGDDDQEEPWSRRHGSGEGEDHSEADDHGDGDGRRG